MQACLDTNFIYKKKRKILFKNGRAPDATPATTHTHKPPSAGQQKQKIKKKTQKKRNENNRYKQQTKKLCVLTTMNLFDRRPSFFGPFYPLFNFFFIFFF